jgi:Flp pilus assembly protein TadD
MMVMEEDIDSIISKYKKMIKENDRDPKAHRELGIAYSVKGDYESAVKELKKAAALDPESSESHYALGLALDMTGKSE